MNIDNLYGVPRSFCSAGKNYFTLIPDGTVSRCVAYHSLGVRIGNILDPEVQEQIIKVFFNKNDSCSQPYCDSLCDGQYSVQIIDGVQYGGHWIQKYPCILMAHITFNCNYQCPYCSQQWWHHQGIKDLDIDKWKEINQVFFSKFKKGLAIVLGGEALIHKNFEEICLNYLQNDWDIQLVTNFSI